MRAKTTVDILCKDLPDLWITRSHRIAVDLLGRHGIKDIKDSLLDVRGSRYVRISQAEIVDIFLSDLLCPFPSILKDFTDRRFFRSKFIHFFIDHQVIPTFCIKGSP